MPPHKGLRRRSRAFVHQTLFVLLILLAAASAAVGAWNGVRHSQDLQWSGAHVLAQHIDPWAEYLRGDPQHRFVQSQVPNYLAVTYLVMLPFGLLPLGSAKLLWVLCNLLFAAGSGWLAANAYGIRGRGVITVICLMLLATPTRTSVGNGQWDLLVLFLWCMTLLKESRNAGRAVFTGVAYGKFSFAPPVFLWLLFRGRASAALWSLASGTISILMVWVWISDPHHFHSLLQLAVEPFRVAQSGYSWGNGDQNLMAIMDPFLRAFNPHAKDAIELGTALTLCAWITWNMVRQRGSVRWQVAILATMSYGLFKHHPYDAVMLLLPLCYALRLWRDRAAKLVLGLIAYLFYAQRVLEALHLHPPWAHLAEFAAVMVILRTTYKMRETDPATSMVSTPAGRVALVA